MPGDAQSGQLDPMDEVMLEIPWLDGQERTEEHCVACDPGGDIDDPVEPVGGEASFIDVDEPLPDLF